MNNQNHNFQNQTNDVGENPSNIQVSDLIEYACDDLVFLTSEGSLLEGILFIDTHGLHNIRYFSPYINHYPLRNLTCSKLVDPCTSNEDKLIEKLIKVLCKLFPSDLGTISITTGPQYNLYSFLSFLKENSTKRNDIKILAGLLFCSNNIKYNKSLIKLDNFEISFLITSSCSASSCYIINVKHCDSKMTDKYESVIETLNTLLNVDVNTDVVKSDLLIKSYIALYLKASDLTQLYSYYQEIFDFFGTKCSHKESYSSVKHCLGIISQAFYFPYQKSLELPYAYVPIDKQIQEHLKQPKGYWNCVENSLYHFLNCLLWDGDNNRYIKINSKTPCKIDMIFTGSMRGTPDKITLEFWHKLIEDLPSGRHIDQIKDGKKLFISYDETIERIFYVQQETLGANNGRSYNFEIETGFINFIKVIEVLSDKQGILVQALQPALVKDENGQVVDMDLCVLEKCLHQIIQLLVGPENAQNYQVSIKKADFKCEHARKDVYGELWVRRKYPKKGAEVEFMLSQESGHAYVMVNMINRPDISVDNLSAEINEQLMKNRPVLGNLLKSYIQHFIKDKNNISKENTYFDTKKIHELMLGFRLEASSEINILLSNLINQYILTGSKEESENLVFKSKVQIFCSNVLNRLPIYDPETLKSLIYPIYTMKAWLEIDPVILDELKEMHDFLSYSFSYKIHNDSDLTDTITKFDEFIQQALCEAPHQSLDGDKIINSKKNCEKWRNMKNFFEKKSDLFIKKFENFSKNPKVSIFELRDTLDNILCFFSMYDFFVISHPISDKKLIQLEYYMYMNMLFSNNVKKETMIRFVRSFIQNLEGEKFEKILAIAEILEAYDQERYFTCIQVIRDKIMDYELGMRILLSCHYNDRENQFGNFLLKACDDNIGRENYVENLISKHEEMVFNEINDELQGSFDLLGI
ncbi:hypothetical protein BpHYR1_052158 [Brachionus plicatilis]|uniref:Uncharacterized protein n=1 Tax=Brachionus plicatilis TaxID=10195 RepID=A0A3M7R4F4_BRAPC|nr:hypothetical protein BpHYR1_052158 [Brachionus plicatilis]